MHKFDAATLLPSTHGTTTLHQEQILPSAAGCGLVNHPDGTLYSNTSLGVTNLDPVTGMPIRTIGQPGNRLGIAVDPQTDRLVYVGSGCNGSLNEGSVTEAYAIPLLIAEHFKGQLSRENGTPKVQQDQHTIW